MNSSQIAKFISIINITAICVPVFFVTGGILAFISRKAGRKSFRAGIFFNAFCIASLAAFAAEFTFFNFPSYFKYFAGPPVKTTVLSPEDPNVVLTSDGTHAELLGKAMVENCIYQDGVKFKNLDRKVTSVFAGVVFDDSEVAEMRVWWRDGESLRGYTKKIYKHLPGESYMPVHTTGNVSELNVAFRNLDPNSSSPTPIGIVSVALNERIPFNFNGLRLLFVSLLFFAFFVFFHKGLRARASFYLFEYRFNSASGAQNAIYVFSVASLVFFSWACIYTTPANTIFLRGPVPDQYNKYLVDALMQGRTWLDYGSPEKLLGAARPYDAKWLEANGYVRNTDWVLDWVWHNGKFYSYAGVVPAVILFLPYKALTGNYLSMYAAVFLLASVVICLLAALWRFCVKKYMPDARFAFYLLSFPALFFASGMLAALRFPALHSMVQIAGLMLVVAGVLLLLKSVQYEKVNYPKVFFACLCFALAVGCRPNMILASVFVPVVLWRHRSWKLAAFILIPFVMVAIPLCMYNYARFGGIRYFGAVITVMNVGAYGTVNPLMKAFRIFVSVVFFLILPNRYSLYFPFVEYLPQNHSAVSLDSFMYGEVGGGMINFPIVFCLFYLFKNIRGKSRFQAFHIVSAFLAIAAAMIYVASWAIGFCQRYVMDFAVFIILPSLFCAYYWCNDRDSRLPHPFRMKIAYVLLAASIFVGSSLFVTGLGMDTHSPQDPALYRYLECAFGFIRNY